MDGLDDLLSMGGNPKNLPTGQKGPQTNQNQNPPTTVFQPLNQPSTPPLQAEAFQEKWEQFNGPPPQSCVTEKRQRPPKTASSSDLDLLGGASKANPSDFLDNEEALKQRLQGAPLYLDCVASGRVEGGAGGIRLILRMFFLKVRWGLVFNCDVR